MTSSIDIFWCMKCGIIREEQAFMLDTCALLGRIYYCKRCGSLVEKTTMDKLRKYGRVKKE